MVKGPGERRGGHDGDVVFAPDLPDLHRHLVDPLGQYLGRRPRLARIVFERHRVVGRVGDDHIGLGDIPHHAAHGHLHLQLAYPPLDLGLAFAVLELVLDLLLGHLELAIVVPALERHIDGDNGDQGAAEDDQHPEQQVQGIDDAAGKALEREIQQMVELA